MLYASTKSALTKELGDSKFIHTIRGSVISDVNGGGYAKYLSSKEAEAPLTEREIEMRKIKLAQASVDTSIASRQSHTQGISFTLSNESQERLAVFVKDEQYYFGVFELVKDILEFHYHSQKELNEIQALLPASSPSFSIYKLNSNQGFVFFYTCPNSSSIKEKMKYSSAKASAVSHSERIMESKFVKKYEVELPSELESDMIQSKDTNSDISSTRNTIHKGLAFAKPARPGRGNARVVE